MSSARLHRQKEWQRRIPPSRKRRRPAGSREARGRQLKRASRVADHDCLGRKERSGDETGCEARPSESGVRY